MSFEQTERRLRDRQLRTARALREAWEQEAKRQLRRHHQSRTGRLENSIRGRVDVAGPTVRVVMQTGDLIQARTTNRGARPHVIRPRTRQYLAFHWDKATPSMRRLPDGRVLFRSVNHPGNRGSRWFDKAADLARTRLLPRLWRASRRG